MADILARMDWPGRASPLHSRGRLATQGAQSPCSLPASNKKALGGCFIAWRKRCQQYSPIKKLRSSSRTHLPTHAAPKHRNLEKVVTYAIRMRSRCSERPPPVFFCSNRPLAIIDAGPVGYPFLGLCRRRRSVVVNKDVAFCHAAFCSSSGWFRSGFSHTPSFKFQSRVSPVQRSGRRFFAVS
jgi:hypothetical protein